MSVWLSTPDPDRDIGPCGRCGCDVVLDHDPPCPHGWLACPGCGHEGVCRECQVIAEREMFQSGTYNAKADPLVDHSEATAARDAAYWAQPAWRDLGARPEEDSA